MKELPKDWEIKSFDDYLDYIQPTPYIVESTDYDDSYKIPVLTAGKSFIKGYTNEANGIFNSLPVIIFDDFTTANKFVNFPFKVKSSAMKILKPKDETVNIKFVFYYMQTVRVSFDTHKRYWISVFSKLPIPSPPKPTQLAIVSKIEELFSELEKGIESLFTAKQQLKTYRQSVLKWAFEGKLTKEWRKKNSMQNGEDVLRKIDNKRTEVLRKLIAKGNKESNRVLGKIKKHKFKEPDNIKMPTDWCWTSFMDACYLVVDCHNKTAPYQETGIYLIRTSNIKNGKLLLEEKMKFVSEQTYSYWSRRCPPEYGDILFTREAPMGEAAIIPNGIQVCMGQRIMLLRTFPELLSNKYLHYAIMESTFQQRMNNNAIGTGVKHLRVGDVEDLAFPICSTEEQNAIVEAIESRLSIADKMEESITQSLQQAEALKQSILKKAFEGKLI